MPQHSSIRHLRSSTLSRQFQVPRSWLVLQLAATMQAAASQHNPLELVKHHRMGLILSKPPGLLLDLTALLWQSGQRAHLLLLGLPMKPRSPQAQYTRQTPHHWRRLAVRCTSLPFYEQYISFAKTFLPAMLQCLCCCISILWWHILPCVCSSICVAGHTRTRADMM